MNSNKDKVIDTVTDVGGSAVGALVGAGIGTVVAGPGGAAGGAIAGTLIERAIQWAGSEIKERKLSKSEDKKVGSVYMGAISKINANLIEGRCLRSDDFYEESYDNRSTAEEVLEGTLFAAQREAEEKKLPYMANLYANINFDNTITRSMANQLVKIASDITYRQLVILSVVGKCNYGITELPLREQAFRGFDNYSDMSIAAEIFDLYRSSLIISSTAILDAASFTPSLLVMNGMGELLFTHMELSTMPTDEITAQVISFLTDNTASNPQDHVITGQLPIREEVEAILDEHTMSKEDIDAIIDEKTANIPWLSFETEETESGGQTLIIDGGNASGKRSYTDTKWIEDKLSEI